MRDELHLRLAKPNLGLSSVMPGDGIWKWLSGGQDTVRTGYGIGYQRPPIRIVNYGFVISRTTGPILGMLQRVLAVP